MLSKSLPCIVLYYITLVHNLFIIHLVIYCFVLYLLYLYNCNYYYCHYYYYCYYYCYIIALKNLYIYIYIYIIIIIMNIIINNSCCVDFCPAGFGFKAERCFKEFREVQPQAVITYI